MNFITAVFDGIILRLGLSVLFGIVLDMKYMGFWLGDALANFTPLWVGMLFYRAGQLYAAVGGDVVLSFRRVEEESRVKGCKVAMYYAF